MSFNDVQQKPVPQKNCRRERTRKRASRAARRYSDFRLLPEHAGKLW